MILLLGNISHFGKGLLAVVFLLYGFAAVFGLVALKLETGSAKEVFFRARAAVYAAAGFSVAALGLLTIAFLADDFSIAAVSRHSSTALHFLYKLSAVWAGSAGSLLLWSVGVFILFGLWLIKSDSDNLTFNAIALSIGAGLCLGFSALLVFVVKPFASCTLTVDDGAGLNPLLQNFWNVIHPPLLFVGYSSFSIPFVIVSASVFAGRAQVPAIYRQLRRWLLFGLCFLGLGIATGAKWSYVELGWGGYWAWDPVENASLLPWLVAVAALHSLASMRNAEKVKLWTAALAPGPFILCLFATFITRSGVLQSVHAFGQNIMFSALLTFIGCCCLLWLICIIRAVKGSALISPFQKGAFRLEKSSLLFWANIIFVFTAVVIGTATFWPVIWKVFTNLHSGLALSRAFYDRVISVVGILLAFLVGLSALTDLQKRSGFILKLFVCCSVGLAGFLGCSIYTVRYYCPLCLACGICAFSSVAVLMKLGLNLKAGSKIGGSIAHLGLLLLVVTAGSSSNEQVVQARLLKAEEIALGGYTIVYDAFKRRVIDDVTKVGPEIILRKKGLTKRLWPHNNLYPSGQSTAEVAVHTGLLEDIYISFDSVGWDGRVTIEAKLKPLMVWLWSSFLLIVAGLAWALFEGKRVRK